MTADEIDHGHEGFGEGDQLGSIGVDEPQLQEVPGTVVFHRDDGSDLPPIAVLVANLLNELVELVAFNFWQKPAVDIER